METNTKTSHNLAQMFEDWGIQNVLPKVPKTKKKEGFTSVDDAYGRHMNRFSVGDDKISQFFIGSFTVVGLFVLYRFMHKK
jgi:hypothetical protein